MEHIWSGIVDHYVVTGLVAVFVASWHIVGKRTGRFRTPLDLITSVVTGGIVQTYHDFERATHHIAKNMATTSEVRFLAIRGFPVIHDISTLYKSLHDNIATLRNCPIKVMILDPDGSEAVARSKIYAKIAPETPELYINQIRESIRTISDIRQPFQNFSFRLYNEAAAFRVLLLDGAAFVGFYSYDTRGATSKVIRVKPGSDLYKVFSYYFDRVWAHGADVGAPLATQMSPKVVEAP